MSSKTLQRLLHRLCWLCSIAVMSEYFVHEEPVWNLQQELWIRDMVACAVELGTQACCCHGTSRA